MNYLVVCPVYNEEKYIREFYERLRQDYKRDVLFVDDGSTDKSRDFLAGIESRDVLLLRHPQRVGYGAALSSGFDFSLKKNYKNVVTIDVDLQHSPACIQSFFNELKYSETVLGSRYIRIGCFLDIPRTRLAINRYISKLIKILFAEEFSDPFCGFRGYRSSFLKKACFKERGYGISLEIILEIVRTKASFKEIPIEAVYFKDKRDFLDGLDDPRKRLLYYLDVIKNVKERSANDEKKGFSGKLSSRRC